MKKYILGLTIISIFAITNTMTAMEKDKKKEIKTSLSDKQVTELRQAMIDYKKDKSRSKQEKIINKYQQQYPNDPFVKAKLNEKARFDNPEQPVKKSKTKETPSVQQPVKEEEIQITEQPVEGESNLRITNREPKKIEVKVYYADDMLRGAFRKIIEPQETILVYVPVADRRDFCIDVSVLDSSGNRNKGYSDIFRKRIEKGQMLDLVYEDDRKFHPWISQKLDFDGGYYSSKFAPHLHKIDK